MNSSIQFSLFLHSDQAHNTSGIQGQEATAVSVI